MRLTKLSSLALASALALGTSAAVASAQGHFRLTSPDVKQGSKIAEKHVFNSFGCSGQNVSPALNWTGAPAGTKSFAVTVYDPDAPTGSGFWHWVVYNIPAATTSLAAGAGSGTGLPSGATQGMTDFGKPGYGGPCPPQGDKPHHYIFTVYALKTAHLDIPNGSTPAFIGFNIHGNQLAKPTFTARYGR